MSGYELLIVWIVASFAFAAGWVVRELLAGQVQAHHGTPARSVPVPQADSPSRDDHSEDVS